MERKAGHEWKEIVDRVVTGFSSIFGNVDDGGDVIEPGAYRKTLAERGGRLRWLWQHDAGQPPIAKIVEIREAERDELPAELLSQFPEASGGLLVRREYLDTPRGNEVLAGLRAGAIGEMSIGYDAIQAEFPQGLAVAGRPVRRRLKEIRLWECSDVLWGMNAATANLKALERKAVAEWIESRIHLNFTEIADDLFGNGLLTREERIALSGLIGDALTTFNQGMAASDVLAGVRQRERWEEPGREETPSAPAIEMMMAMRQRRLAVMERALRVVS